jgi:putative transposase
MGRPMSQLTLSADERSQLESMARSRSMSAALVQRAKIVLGCAEGAPNTEVAECLGTHKATVGLWRRRFVARRIAGLYDELRPGKPRTIDDERVAELTHTTLHKRPSNGATQWSVRDLEAETGISKTSVQRYLSLFGVQPHRTQSFKLSTDPFFVDKLRDVVGLYLNPPDNALVVCVDEKSQCQALERTQPMLPMGLGYVEGVTHDYKRHGTTTLFAALDVLTGAVLSTCKPRHRHQEFLSFLREIDKAVPKHLDIHAIVDNYSAHKHPRVKAWLAARPRWQLHFIPTYSSGSIWSSDSSRSSPIRRFAAVRFDPLKISRLRSITSSPTITKAASHTCGQRPLIRSLRSSNDFVCELTGRHTRKRTYFTITNRGKPKVSLRNLPSLGRT